jgi:hypothetical protein
MKKSKVGIVIDNVIRIPNFIESYTNIKEIILAGNPAADMLSTKKLGVVDDDGDSYKPKIDIDLRNFWQLLANREPECIPFYQKTPIPSKDFGPDFDITWDKYFYSREHKLKFLEEYSYSLFGQGAVANKADIILINTAQSKLCDIVLIDIASHTRKIPNTFAFLGRSGLFIKELVFINTLEELGELKKSLVDIWNPFEDATKKIEPSKTIGKATPHFLNWFMALEKKIKNIEIKK